MAKSKVEKWLTPEGLTLLGGWARDGLTEEEIAKKMKVSRSTLNNWKNKYLDILDTLKKNKQIIDYEVEQALLKKCFGYNQKVLKNIKVKTTEYDPDTGRKLLEKEEIVEVYDEIHIPADTTAEIVWLKNRMPDKWRDKPVKVDDDDGVVIVDDIPKE